jgi:hypothetical protein
MAFTFRNASKGSVIEHVSALRGTTLIAPCPFYLPPTPETHLAHASRQQTLAAYPVVSTPFGVCEMHTVLGEEGQVINDWLWFDEKDQVK